MQVDEGDDGFTSDGGNSPSHSKQAWELIKQASPSALLQRLSPKSPPQQQQLQLHQQQQSLSIVSPVPRDGAIECPVTEPQAVAQAPGGRRNSLARRVFDSTLPARHRSKASLSPPRKGSSSGRLSLGAYEAAAAAAVAALKQNDGSRPASIGGTGDTDSPNSAGFTANTDRGGRGWSTLARAASTTVAIGAAKARTPSQGDGVIKRGAGARQLPMPAVDESAVASAIDVPAQSAHRRYVVHCTVKAYILLLQ
jgi:hypothetical protein